MKLLIASDHAGYELKQQLLAYLKTTSTEAVDFGTDSTASCDYPVFARKVAEAIQKDSSQLGLLICGTGIGMSIAANKLKGIRAACVSEEKSAELSRQHNNANILCLGARIISFDKAKLCLNAFLCAQFDTANPRHANRIAMLE